MDKQAESLPEKYRNLTGFWRWLSIVLSAIGLLVVINQLFHLGIGGVTLLVNSYYYLILAFYLSFAFLVYPIKSGGAAKRFFWLDATLFFLTFGISVFFAIQGYDIIWRGWGFTAPPHMAVLSVIMWVLLLEAVRRTGSIPLLIVIGFFSIYPVFSDYMPSFLQGPGRQFTQTAAYHFLTMNSVLGVGMSAVADLVIGFIIFGIVLQATGGGKFFFDLSSSLLGTRRGGPAKVSVLASALFGSLSGSVVANVVATGSVTIPAMKKSGFRSEDAGAIEACASTGGVLMPPIMGAVAFVMAAFLDISYSTIALAAAIPSVLYYFSLFIQVDSIAAIKGLRGIPRNEVPQLIKTLKEGWLYPISLGILIYFLFVERLTVQAPFYATAAVIILSMLRKETRLTLKSSLQLLQASGRFLTELVVLLAAVGLIIGSLSYTGVAATLARELVALAGDNILAVLILGALASCILGMALPSVPCYVFLALVLGPALTEVGWSQLSIHLFILYWGIMSAITPPVAFAAIAAAVIAQTSATKVAFSAMRLGGVIFILPFFFVYNPALLLQGNAIQIAYSFFFTLLGITFIASGLGGYAWGLGKIDFGGRAVSSLLRIALLATGVLLAMPIVQTNIIGLVIGAALIGLMLLIKNRRGASVKKTFTDT